MPRSSWSVLLSGDATRDGIDALAVVSSRICAEAEGTDVAAPADLTAVLQRAAGTAEVWLAAFRALPPDAAADVAVQGAQVCDALVALSRRASQALDALDAPGSDAPDFASGSAHVARVALHVAAAVERDAAPLLDVASELTDRLYPRRFAASRSPLPLPLDPQCPELRMAPHLLKLVAAGLTLRPADSAAALRLYTLLFDLVLSCGAAALQLLGSDSPAECPEPHLQALSEALGPAMDCPGHVYVNIDAAERLASHYADLLRRCHATCLGSARHARTARHFPGEHPLVPAWAAAAYAPAPPADPQDDAAPAQVAVARLMGLCGHVVLLSAACPRNRQQLLDHFQNVAPSDPTTPLTPAEPTSSSAAAPGEAAPATDEDADGEALECPVPAPVADVIARVPPAPRGGSKKVRILAHSPSPFVSCSL